MKNAGQNLKHFAKMFQYQNFTSKNFFFFFLNDRKGCNGYLDPLPGHEKLAGVLITPWEVEV